MDQSIPQGTQFLLRNRMTSIVYLGLAITQARELNMLQQVIGMVALLLQKPLWSKLDALRVLVTTRSLCKLGKSRCFAYDLLIGLSP